MYFLRDDCFMIFIWRIEKCLQTGSLQFDILKRCITMRKIRDFQGEGT